MVSEKAVWLIVLSSSAVVFGITSFSCDTERHWKGSDAVCTCVTPNNIEWQLNDVALSTCITSGICSPKPAGYVFQTDISTNNKEYSLTVQDFDYSSCTVYSCTDTTTLVEEKKTLFIAAFNYTEPSEINEPGAEKDGSINITTECLFKKSSIVVKWFTFEIKTDKREEYDPPGAFSTPAACSDTCNGETAVTLTIGFQHSEEHGQIKKEVKFQLEVYHIANEINKLELETVGTYYIKDNGCDHVCKAGIGLGVAVVLLYIIGCIIACIKETWVEDKNFKWILLSCIIIVGIGILTVMGIRRWSKKSKEDAGKKDNAAKKTKTKPGAHSVNPHSNQATTVTFKNEHKDQFRPQPPPPGGGATGTPTIHGRDESYGAVSREDVEIQESGSYFTRRPMPAIPPVRYSKGRGLSANFEDTDHILENIETPVQRKSALEALNEGPGEEVIKVKKKKKKSRNRDLNEDEE